MNFCNILANTPLFQGMTDNELTQITGQTKFAFHKFAPGTIIKDYGEPCTSMALIIDGATKMVSSADDYGYSVEEPLHAPHIIQPERLFGLTQRYTRQFVADTHCGIMEISKNDIMQLSDEFVIFKINLINVLSTVSQKAERQIWTPNPNDTHGRLVKFFKKRCAVPAGKKTIRIKMTRLAQEIGIGRLAVSKELNRMEKQGLLTFSRGIITVPALEKL